MQQELIAGDSLNFATGTPGYLPGDGWTLLYRLVPRAAGGAPIVLTAYADGDQHRVLVSATSTAAWAPGAYSWASWVEKGAERYMVDGGQIAVRPDPRTAAAGWDNRSPARVALDDARTAYYAWNPTQRRYRIGGREMEFNTAADILVKIRQLEAEVDREDIAAGRVTAQPLRRIQTRL